MANVDMNRLMDNLRIKLPGALDSTIQFELFSALNDFFQQSSIWTENLTFIAQPTSDTYLQNPDAYTYQVVPTMGSIVRLMSVVDSNNFAQAASMDTPGYIVIAYAPSAANTYTANVALTVTDPTTRDGYPEFPAWILNKYGNEIMDGVLSRMMSQVAKPYSSPQMALFYGKKFQAGISRAYVESLHGNVYRGQNWRFPQTFARRRYLKF